MVQLKGLFKLTPSIAIKYFRNKKNTNTWDWYELWQKAHRKSFTVAKVVNDKVLTDIREALDSALSESFKAPLKEYITEKSSDEWLFCSQRGENAITRVQAYRIISQACEKAGITARIGTHTLRKTFGYHFYKEKKDIALLQSILNHSSPSVTLRYIGINQDIIDKNLNTFKL